MGPAACIKHRGGVVREPTDAPPEKTLWSAHHPTTDPLLFWERSDHLREG